MCKPVYGDMRNSAGALMYCFAPYDVNKYKKRLEKAKFLKQKNIEKQTRNDIEIGRDIKIMDIGKDRRQAIEERNIAYMTAEYENWQTLDFVVGFAILRSNRKPRCECNICERLKGDYPKEFKFIGWHPQCHCYTVPILMDGETFNENERRKLRAVLKGEEYKKLEAKNAVTDVPENFKKWVREHRDLCLATSECDTTPDFIKDNREIIDRILKEQERKKFPFLGIFTRFRK